MDIDKKNYSFRDMRRAATISFFAGAALVLLVVATFTKIL